jgi:hypothetical protein
VAVALLWPAGLMAQEAAVTGSEVSLAAGAATLELQLADGGVRVVTLRDGQVTIDGEARGSYEPGGALDRSWRSLLTSPTLFESSNVADRLAAWEPDARGDAEASSGGALEALFDRLAESSNRTAAAAIPEAATMEAPGGGQVAIAPGMIVSLDDLTQSIEVLRGQLKVLGGQVAGLEENLALVVHDDYTVDADRLVEGNLALLSGDLTLKGTVDGDVLVLDGELTLAPSANVTGDILQVGGDVIDAGGKVSGEMVSLLAGELGSLVSGDLAADLAEEIDIPVRVNVRSDERGFFGSIGHNIGHALSGIMAAVVWLLALAVLGFVVVYFFGSRLEVVAQVVRADTVRSFGVGLAGQLLVVPILLLLIVGIVTWLVIPVYALAVALAIPAGYLAVAHAVGESVQEQRFNWMDRFNLRRASSYHYVFNGLLFLVAPFAIGSVLYLLGGMLGFVRGLMFFAAGTLTWGAVTTGFGAIILTRAGGRKNRAKQADFDDLFSAPDSFDSEEGEASA